MPLELKSKLQIYRMIVENGTNRNEREIWWSWDGIGRHSKEDIRENFRLDPYDRYYPTIDHRISVIDGFMNNIPPEEIYDLKNLCATERWLNSTKGRKNEDEFMELIENILLLEKSKLDAYVDIKRQNIGVIF